MKTRKWTVVEVYYNSDEQAKADQKKIVLQKNGYQLNASEQSDNPKFEFCDQYIKS